MALQATRGPQRAFSFLESNRSVGKPRAKGLTEIRGPYSTSVGSTYLRELLEAVGDWVDSLTFAGGAFRHHAS